MIARCYASKLNNYNEKQYVCSRWHSFYNFAMDLQRLSGFEDIGENFLSDGIDNSPSLFYGLGYNFNPKLNK